MKRVLLLLLLVAAGYALKQWPSDSPPDLQNAGGQGTDAQQSAEQDSPHTSQQASDERSQPISSQQLAAAAERLQLAFAQHESNLQIEGQGTVVNVLKDDTKGSPHQRFLLRTERGQTLLVAHNIELAPRVLDLATGDTVRFFGEYEWNEQGGVIHWTHHDPAGRHPGGWLEHRGQRYQ